MSLLISQLQQQFWNETILSVCQTIQEHIDQAKKHIHASTIIENKSILLSFLDPIEKSVEKTRKEHKQAVQFLQTYEKI